MFLHIGGNANVLSKDIILILNLNSALASNATRQFLEISQREGLVTDLSLEKPKSAVLTSEQIYLSGISSQTLIGRSRKSREK
jgi:hypothetical protein